jgi:phosphoribosyl-AMP cyclohydrolase / phosphoribosyl-ATP pyrophosphohydrolase
MSDPEPLLQRLEAVIAARDEQRPAGSYTAELLHGGPSIISAKVIEEAYELVEAIAGLEAGHTMSTEVAHEAADLVFHLLVALRAAGVRWADIERELDHRFTGGR